MSSVSGLLERIVQRRREALARVEEPEIEPRRAPLTVLENRFLAALVERRGAAIIAEVKAASPRSGPFHAADEAGRQARAYAAGGAAAISVVVEPDFFQGSYALLEECRSACGLPAIAKDFVVSAAQLQWAKAAGASAVLLIARLHDPERLALLAGQARALGLVPLLELHERAEIEAAMAVEEGNWELVGINNRDLRTFEVDLERSIDLLASLPFSALKVAESGISNRMELRRLADAGFDAFLIGESLLRAEDPGRKLGELLSTGSGGAREV